MRNNLLPPKPWIVDQPKAFVLGCDPTAFYKNGAPRKFEYVFNLQDKGDKRYFAGILKNLKAFGLGLDCIYVQNLVTDYQPTETSKNKNWNNEALKSIPLRRKEFDDVDPTGNLPVFLTSQHLYKVLLNDGIQPETPATLYKESMPIPAMQNKLGRPLVVLYRHYKYAMDKHPVYQEMIKKNFLNL